MKKEDNAVKILLHNLFEEWFCNLSFQEQIEELYLTNRYWDCFTSNYQERYTRVLFTFFNCLNAGYIEIPNKVSTTVLNKLVKLGYRLRISELGCSSKRG